MRLIFVLAVMLAVALPGPAKADERLAEVQRLLLRAGYDAGPADGVLGPKTREVLKTYQRHKGLDVDGEVNDVLLSELRRERPAPAFAPAPGRISMPASEARAVEDCHELIVWLIPLLDHLPRSRHLFFHTYS